MINSTNYTKKREDTPPKCSDNNRLKQIEGVFQPPNKNVQFVKNLGVLKSEPSPKKVLKIKDKVLNFVLKSPNYVTNKDVHIYFGIRKQKASYHLNKLVEQGLINEFDKKYSPKKVLKNYSDSNAGCVGSQQNPSLNRLQRFDHYHFNFPLSKWPDPFFVNTNWNSTNSGTKGRIQYTKKEMFQFTETQRKIYDPILNFIDFTLHFFYSIKSKSCKLDIVLTKFHFDGNLHIARQLCRNLVNLFLSQYQLQHGLFFDFANSREGPYEYRFCSAPKLLRGQSFFRKNFSCDDSFGDGHYELETQSEKFADLIEDLDDTINLELKGDISKVEALAIDSHKRRAIFEKKIIALLNIQNDELSVLKDYITIKEAKDSAKHEKETMFG